MIWRMRIARWILKATSTHSEYTIGISLALIQWFQRPRLNFTLTYIACLFFYCWFFRDKTARTFINIISTSPISQNNPPGCRRIPLRIVCSLVVPSSPTPQFFSLYCEINYSLKLVFHECVIFHGFEKKEEKPCCLSLPCFLPKSRVHETQRVMTEIYTQSNKIHKVF